MSNPKILHLSDESFDDAVRGAGGPVLVDFWAAWCGPCRAIAPVLDAAADDYDGRATVAKVDVDAAPATAQRFGVRSIPTLLLFRDGEVAGSIVGAAPRSRIDALIESALDADTGPPGRPDAPAAAPS